MIGDGVAIRIVGAGAVQSDGAGGNANLIRTGIGHRGTVAGADAAGQHIVADARDIHWNRVIGGLHFLGTDHVAELYAGYDAAVAAYHLFRFVDAAFHREGDLVVEREDQASCAAGPAAERAVQVADVAFKVVVLPEADCAADAGLVDNLQGSVQPSH